MVTQYRLTPYIGAVTSPTAQTTQIYANTDTTGASQVLTGNATLLANNNAYTFRLETKNSASFNNGYSIMSPLQAATVTNSRAALPGVPRNLRVSRFNMDSITLAWDLNDFSTYSGGNYVGFYFISISSDAGFNPQSKQVGSQTLTTITGLASSSGDTASNGLRTYTFTISAINTIGRSPASPALQQATASSSAMGLASLSLLTIALVALLALLL